MFEAVISHFTFEAKKVEIWRREGGASLLVVVGTGDARRVDPLVGEVREDVVAQGNGMPIYDELKIYIVEQGLKYTSKHIHRSAHVRIAKGSTLSRRQHDHGWWRRRPKRRRLWRGRASPSGREPFHQPPPQRQTLGWARTCAGGSIASI